MKVRIGTVVVGLVVGWWGMPAAGAEEPGLATCYVVADSAADETDEDAEDLLIKVDRLERDLAADETSVGTGTGTFGIEAIAFQPGTGILFAADGGVLGTLDTTTGRFTKIGDIGTGTGSEGKVELDDVDGLAFDPGTGFLYGTRRRSSADLLFRIDPLTGGLVAGGIGGADYAVVPEVEGLSDIDDIAIDPGDGEMYAVANEDGRDDRLVHIDKLTGSSSDIGSLGIEDVEGLGFAGDQLMGTTGQAGDSEGLWDVDKATGAAGNHRPLDNGGDFESFDCFTPAAAVEPAAPPEPAPIRMPQRSGAATLVEEAATPVETAPAAEPAEAAPGPEAEPVALAELPRTGQDGSRQLLLGSGAVLALGGLAVMGGTRRPRRGSRRA